MSDSSIFKNDPHDPFNQPTESTDLSSSWTESSSNVPRWTIKTEQELQEHNDVIHKLETKMKKLKQKKYTHDMTIPDVSDDDDYDESIHEDDDEGLPLLNKNKPIKKTENQYIPSWFNYCCCCLS